MHNEQQWLLKCRHGDKDAFYELVKPHLDRAYSTAVVILHSTHLAEDALQNSMLEAYQSIMLGKEIRNFGAWFKQLVASRALDLARVRAKQVQRTDHLEGTDPPDEQAQPMEALLQKEKHTHLLQQVMSLDIRHRTVIVLHYYEEMSINEIAQLLRLKPGTVKSRLHTARLKLLQQYENSNERQVTYNV